MRCTSEGSDFFSRFTGRSQGQIRYALTEQDGQTHFHRVMDYTEPNLVMRILDALIMRRKMTNVIHAALQKLKTILESAPGRGAPS